MPEVETPVARRRWVSAMPWLAIRVALVWTLAGLVAVWAVVRSFGLDRGSLMAQLIAFTPYVAAGAVVPIVLAVLSGRWVAAVLSGLALVTLVACVLPRAVGSASTMNGVPVRVMSMNMRIGGADAKSIVDLVRSRAVDVLTVQEYTPQARADLAAAGIDDLLPYQKLSPQPGAAGSALYARFPLTHAEVTINPGWGFNQATAVVSVLGGVAVEVHSVHPDPPGLGTGWAAGLNGQAPGGAGSPLRILAGDFNATLDHAQLRQLLRTGYRDAAAEVGHGLVPTWPYYGHRAAFTPKITIDHILVDTGIGVRDFDAVTVPLTDHRAIIATLVVPTGRDG
jgi:endonuclease/exonuclease/phosphatase (EEP) superfamily protein YafD